MSCTNNCNQGRACTCKPQRTCNELGVCQGRNPPCSDQCANPAIVPGGLMAMNLVTADEGDHSPHAEVSEMLRDAALVVAVLFVLIFVVFALLGYFWSKS